MDISERDLLRLSGRETRYLRKQELAEGKEALKSQPGPVISVWGAQFDRAFLADILWRLEKVLGKGLRGLVLE